MKKRKVRLTALFLALSFLLSACGTELYEMTEEEHELIVKYSAYLLAKHNTYQKDGYMDVDFPEEEPMEEPQTELEPEPSETETEGNDIHQPSEGTKPEAQKPLETVSLAESIGHGKDLRVTYQGYTTSDIYKEGKGFILDAENGKTFLILEFALKSITGDAVKVDLLLEGLTFDCKYNGTDTVTQRKMLALREFSTYEGTVKGQETTSCVLIFEIPDAKKDTISDISLTVTQNEVTKAVKL